MKTIEKHWAAYRKQAGFIATLSRYSHVRTEAKRHALDEIAARQRTADEERQADLHRQQQAAVVSDAVVVQ